MNSKDAIEYITNRDWHESRLNLERIEALLDRLGNPQKNLQYVHVAGTNGKGSVCAMTASILTAAGYKTGLYTSPYINCFNERIQVDGHPIETDVLTALTMQVRAEADLIEDHPTEFELITAIAFVYFDSIGCDIVVLEVGLGGRLDATNVIPVPEVAVITPISLDHVAELGDTLEKIAIEKSGIIKQGGCVVSSPQTPGVKNALNGICNKRDAVITFLDATSIKSTQNSIDGQLFDYNGINGLEISLLGAYQLENAAMSIVITELLNKKGWRINELAIRDGLKKAKWPARFEIVHRHPFVIVDGGHNPQCIDSLVDSLNTYFPGKTVTLVAGVMADKDYDVMFLKLLPLVKRVFTVTPDNKRALLAKALSEYFSSKGIQEVKACISVEQGVKEAMKLVEQEEVVCAVGSFYMAGAIRKMFGLS